MADSATPGAHAASRLTTRYVVDVDAYTRLASLSTTASRVRDLDGLDYALHRIYRGSGFSPARRKASGTLLARDLRRDGHRAHDRLAEREILGAVERVASDDAMSIWASDVDAAVRVVDRAAARLPTRERTALTLQARGLLSDETTMALLGVKTRQAQNLARTARAALLDDPEVVAARDTLLDALGSDHMDRIRALLDRVFAGLADLPSS